MGKYDNWCCVKGHKPSCNCAYPKKEDLIACKGGKPGERPMPKEIGEDRR